MSPPLGSFAVQQAAGLQWRTIMTAAAQQAPRVPPIRVLSEVVVAAVLGWAAIVLPVYFDEAVVHKQALFMPIMTTAIVHLKLYSLGLLMLIGFGLAFVTHLRVVWLGIAIVSAWPLRSIVDIAIGGLSRHTLLGIEWGVYLSLAVCGMIGAGIGRWLLRHARNNGVQGPDTIGPDS